MKVKVNTERLDGLLDYLRTHVTYIEAMGMRKDEWTLNSPYQAVLRYGRVCGPAVPFHRDDFEDQTPRECFANALHAAIRDRSLTYVEGYAYDESIPIHHAWVVDRDGNVLDPTWGYRKYAVYVGIPLRTRWTWDKVIEQDCYGVLHMLNARRGLPKRALSTRKVGEPVPGPEIDMGAVRKMRATLKRGEQAA